jgi:hypothetical protein
MYVVKQTNNNNEVQNENSDRHMQRDRLHCNPPPPIRLRPDLQAGDNGPQATQRQDLLHRHQQGLKRAVSFDQLQVLN